MAVSRLRFCLLTTFYPPFNFGGDGIDVQRTARALVARGHHVTVVHEVDAYVWLSGRRPPAEATDTDGVEVIGLRSRLGVLSPLITHQTGYPVVHRRTLNALLRDGAFDVVVFNNISLVGGPGLLSFGEASLRIYLAHEHWLVCPTHVLWRFNREPCDKRACLTCVLTYRRPPQLWRFTGVLERSLSDVDLFIARSEFSRQKHVEFGFAHPMQVLPYFIPGKIPTAPERLESARPQQRPYFVFVGRLTKIKGLDSIIPAFSLYPEADLLIIGDGEEGPALRALAASVPNVKFVGRVPNTELGSYYEHAVASVVPSSGFETFGIVLIESFRHGTPVIARRLGPFPEIIEQSHGGLLFSDQAELLAAMTRLHSDAAYRNTLANNGFRACREHWSEEAVVGRFLEIVSRGIAARNATRGGPKEPNQRAV